MQTESKITLQSHPRSLILARSKARVGLPIRPH